MTDHLWAYIILHYYGVVPPSLIKVGYNHYTFKSGQKVRLVCPLYGIPTPSIKWSRNGTRVLTQKEPDADGYHIYKTKASLVISRIKPSDSGIYVCTAKNKVGKSSFNFTIRVQGMFMTTTWLLYINWYLRLVS